MKIWLKVIMKDELARVIATVCAAVVVAIAVASAVGTYKSRHPEVLDGFDVVFTVLFVFGLVITCCAVFALGALLVSMWVNVIRYKVGRETEDLTRHAAHSGRLTEYSATSAREGDLSTPEPAPTLPTPKARPVYVAPAPETAVVARASGYETPGFAVHIRDAEDHAAYKAELRAKLASVHRTGDYHDPEHPDVVFKKC